VGAHILWFDEYDDAHAPVVGGKCASLGAMTRVGLPVPMGFAVTTDGFMDSVTRNDVGRSVDAALGSLDVRDLDALTAAAEQARQAVMDSGPARAVEQSVRSAYAELNERTEHAEAPVAIRSSATAEDQPDASFAGQQDTYLWVRGADDVVHHVVRCWASLYTDRAIAYRAEQGYAHEQVAMCVGVQIMLTPKAAGVAFTIDPTNGDRSKVVIDAAWGLGESVVSGTVTPDNFVVDKVIFEIVKRTISAKEVECVLDHTADRVVQVALSPERSAEPCLTDAEVKAVARLARQAEKHFGRPQDVEWALSHGDDGEPAVSLLQSRPETVWSNRARVSVSSGIVSPMDGIVSTLLTPVRVRNPQ
jgi:pyruvate,water dikinase